MSKTLKRKRYPVGAAHRREKMKMGMLKRAFLEKNGLVEPRKLKQGANHERMLERAATRLKNKLIADDAKAVNT